MPDGTDRTYPPSGKVARVVSYEIAAGNFAGIPTVHRRLGAVEGLPPDGEPCLVSALVLSALPAGTPGVYAPIRAPPHSATRPATWWPLRAW
jgi:hypothetical protein